MMMTILVGLLVGLAAYGAASLLAPRTYGRPAWARPGKGKPGSLPYLLRSVGQLLAGPVLNRMSGSLIRPVMEATGLDEPLLLGILGMLIPGIVLSAQAAVWTGPAAVAALLLVMRISQQEGQFREALSWETDVVRLLQELRLGVAAGLNLRQAVERASPRAEGVARELTDHLLTQFSAGVDAAAAFQSLAADLAPDASTKSFFLLFATALRTGQPQRPLLDAEVGRLQDRRRLRLRTGLENLTTKLVMYRAISMLAAMALIFAWAFTLMGSIGDIAF